MSAIREFNVLQASDSSFIVRGDDGSANVVIKTYRQFPDLVAGLQADLSAPYEKTTATPMTKQ